MTKTASSGRPSPVWSSLRSAQNALSHFFQRLINLGTHDLEPHTFQLKSVRMANTLSLAISILIPMVGSLIVWITGKFFYLVPAGMELLLASQVFVLNKFRRFQEANYLLFILQCLSVIYFTYELGDALDLEIVTIFLAIILFILFNQKKERLIASICLIITFIAIQYLEYFQHYQPLQLSPAQKYIINLSAKLGLISLIIIVGQLYVRANDVRERLEMDNQLKAAINDKLSHDCRNIIQLGEGVALNLEDQAIKAGIGSMFLEGINQMRGTFQLLKVQFNNILDASQKASGKHLELMSYAFKTKDFFNQIILLYKACCNAYHRPFHYEVSGRLPRMLVGDIQKLEQILMNLWSNALKHGLERSPIDTKIAWTNNQLDIQVSNINHQVSRPELQSLFKKFESGRNSGAFVSSGLGLNDIKETVQLMNGSIEATVENGKVTFRVRMTMHQPCETTSCYSIAPRHPSDHGQFSESSTNSLALVVDDDEINRQYLKALLKKSGYEVVTANDGDDAIMKTAELNPKLIFLDLHMPGTDGRYALRAIRQINGIDVQVVMVTGNSHVLDDKQLAAMADGVLVKPIRSTDVSQLLAQLGVGR